MATEKSDVDVVFRILNTNGSIKKEHYFQNVPLPLDIHDLDERLKTFGYEPWESFLVLWSQMLVDVTSGPSEYRLRQYGAKINIDQPLLHFYNHVYRKAAYPEAESPNDTSVTTLNPPGVNIGNASIVPHRTVRVPEGDKNHDLPPSMGVFPLYNVAAYADKLPEAVVQKGGIFLPMYQREALWLKFGSEKDCAAKVYVDGINAVTGLEREKKVNYQDYICLNDDKPQLRLDGISVKPGIVKQFAAMPPNQGSTVESQTTGPDAIGGIQIEVYNAYEKTVEFNIRGYTQALDLYKTPRQLGLRSGSSLRMVETVERQRTISRDSQPRPLKLESPKVPQLVVNVSAHINIIVQVPTGTRTSLLVVPVDPFSTIGRIKEMICYKEKLSGKNYRLQQGATLFYEFDILQDCLNVYSPYSYNDPNRLKFELTPMPSPISNTSDGLYQKGALPDKSLMPIIAPGGNIVQKVYTDKLPTVAYDQRNPIVLNITFVNPAYFASITGLEPADCPIDSDTYKKLGLPWLTVYDEHIPLATNADSLGPPSLAQSVAQVIKGKEAARLGPESGGLTAETSSSSTQTEHFVSLSTQEICRDLGLPEAERAQVAAFAKMDMRTQNQVIFATLLKHMTTLSLQPSDRRSCSNCSTSQAHVMDGGNQIVAETKPLTPSKAATGMGKETTAGTASSSRMQNPTQAISVGDYADIVKTERIIKRLKAELRENRTGVLSFHSPPMARSHFLSCAPLATYPIYLLL